jgi:hypothetical protein
VIVEVGIVILGLVLLSGTNCTRIWKREDGRENPDSQNIFHDHLLLAHGSTRQSASLNMIVDERTTAVSLQ